MQTKIVIPILVTENNNYNIKNYHYMSKANSRSVFHVVFFALLKSFRLFMFVLFSDYLCLYLSSELLCKNS